MIDLQYVYLKDRLGYGPNTTLEEWIVLLRQQSNPYDIEALLLQHATSTVVRILTEEAMNRTDIEERNSYIISFFTERPIATPHIQHLIDKPSWFRPYLEKEMIHFTAFKQQAKKVKNALLNEEPANEHERTRIKLCYNRCLLERCNIIIHKALSKQIEYHNELVQKYKEKIDETEILQRYFENLGYITKTGITFKGFTFLDRKRTFYR